MRNTVPIEANEMIEGVKIRKLQPIPDERGRLTEILRNDDELFTEFGQVYMTTLYPGVVKAWHYHENQTDCMTVVSGMAKLVLYDARDDSDTKGRLMEFFMGIHNPLQVKIPCGVYHGFKGVGEEEALIINVTDRVYDRESPDEHRIDPHDNDIPYRWERKDG